VQGTNSAVLPAEGGATAGAGPARGQGRPALLVVSGAGAVPHPRTHNHEYGYWGGESEEDRHLAGFTVSAPIGVRARLQHQAG
jgi:hypothetical protein